MPCTLFYWTHILLIPLVGTLLILLLRLAARRPLNYVYPLITAAVFGLTIVPPLEYILVERPSVVEMWCSRFLLLERLASG